MGISVYADVNRYVIFADLSQLVAVLSETPIQADISLATFIVWQVLATVLVCLIFAFCSKKK